VTNPRLAVSYEHYKQLYSIASGGQEPEVDCDILVELYAVNASERTRYIRDAVFQYDIDGQTVRLSREREFSFVNAGDGRKFEYCLDIKSRYWVKTRRENGSASPAKVPMVPPLMDARRSSLTSWQRGLWGRKACRGMAKISGTRKSREAGCCESYVSPNDCGFTLGRILDHELTNAPPGKRIGTITYREC
jgi:hypothetical protein